MDEMFDQMKDQNVTRYKQSVERDRFFGEKSEKDIEVIKTSVTSDLKKNWILAEATFSQSEKFVKEIESDLEESRNALTEYRKSVETNTAELQERTSKNKSAILSSVQVSENIQNYLK